MHPLCLINEQSKSNSLLQDHTCHWWITELSTLPWTEHLPLSKMPQTYIGVLNLSLM